MKRLNHNSFRGLLMAFGTIALLPVSCHRNGEHHLLSYAYPEKTTESAALLQEMGTPFLWENATIYFLLTDRFRNGDPSNDVNFGRTGETGIMRGFEGGDFSGVTEKLEAGYFDSLGITALWLTPYFEQVHGFTDEGTGDTYGYHGYWTKDWTRVDPNYGTEAELAELVREAHERGIRILMDVVINHTGPVTDLDPVWPDAWVRTGPPCTFQSYETTVSCTLVENLPDIRTESDEPVELPEDLLLKWEREGRLAQELAGLDAFFARTGFPRAPKYYVIKWLTDLVRRYGIDGYRLDTAKHIEESVWSDLGREARIAFMDWKKNHPQEVLDDNEFYMVAEVYGYGISSGRYFSFGDREVDYFSHCIDAMINFEFKNSAHQSFETLFSSYSNWLEGALDGKGVLNYISSHDDSHPFDRERTRPLEAGTKLLLCPGSAQIYYGDETSRELVIPGAVGDAGLRGRMNWEEIGSGASRNGIPVCEVLTHYRRLGQFRKDHPAVGAGVHRKLSGKPYLFSRSYSGQGYEDRVVVGLDLDPGRKRLKLKGVFSNGTLLTDYYSGTRATVRRGKVTLHTPGKIVLLGME
ncbi:MAG TPA: alpha-amlyase [Bacteroides sp.]|mgnify:CR=1 FL=1|nr:alpha-amlyase [Bacteroides sp.]